MSHTPDPHDLEVICTMLEIGAILLTNNPGDSFTFDELFESANSLDPSFGLDKNDCKIVFDNHNMFSKINANKWKLKQKE